jgi:hypothetical protein
LTNKTAEAASDGGSHMIACGERLLLVFQLLEYIGGGIVHWNQTRVGTVHDMAASDFFFTKESMQSVCKLLSCCPRYHEWDFNTLPELPKNGLQEGNDHTTVNLMHGVAHVNLIDTKIWNQPERVEE